MAFCQFLPIIFFHIDQVGTKPTIDRKCQFVITEGKEVNRSEACAKLTGKLVMVDEDTHWIHHEQPELVNRLIQEFIEGHRWGR